MATYTGKDYYMEERPQSHGLDEEMDPEIKFRTKSEKSQIHKSTSSRHSQNSSASISSIIARKRASIESAKVGLQFVKQEADLKIVQAEMESKLLVLKQEKKIAMIPFRTVTMLMYEINI